MKQLSLVILLSLVSWSSGVASDFAISLDSVVGLYGPSSLNTNQQLTFYLRLTNNGTYPMKGITNGFRVYSPNGATWDTTVGDNDLGTIGSSDFDLIWVVNKFGLTGSGADTLGFGGATMSATGLLAGFDDTAFTITIGPIPAQDHGETVCLDSAYYPPSGLWLWDGGIVDSILIGDRLPTWDGPHCFTVLDSNGAQCLIPSPGVVTLTTQEEVQPADESLQIDAFDTDSVLDVSVANNQAWLQVEPQAGGTTPLTLTVSADVTGLSAGQYFDTITVTADGVSNSPLEVPCMFTVQPLISAMPYWGFLAWAKDGNQAPPETLIVTATDGVSAIPFSANADSAWLSITPSSGTTPKTLVVQSDGRNLQFDTWHTAIVTLTPTGGSFTSLQQSYRVHINDEVTAVKETGGDNLPTTYSLSQNYPNPFNPNTEIAFDLPTRTHITLTVYNMLGQRVTTLVNELLAAGSYVAEWDGRSSSGQPSASGIYFYRLETENFAQTKKMVLLK